MEARETLVRIVLVALLLYAAACLLASRRELYAAGREEQALSARLEAIEQENLAVGRHLTEGWSEEELEALARERLGLVLPGDRVFRFPSENPEEAPGVDRSAGRISETRQTERIIHGVADR